MADVGNVIKYYRIKANVTQAQLAKGIISVPHLSKIERGLTNPTQDILDLLLKRLNVSKETNEPDQIERLCEKWFHQILSGDKENAKQLYEEIISQEKHLHKVKLDRLVDIHKFHYYILNEETRAASVHFQQLKKLVPFFGQTEKYYWSKFAGNYNFSIQSYAQAFDYYMEAEKLLNEDNLFSFDVEKHDLFYLIALTSRKLQRVFQTISYAQEALDYYQVSYRYKRCAECHVLLGLSYRRIEEYDKAIQEYNHAMSIGEKLNNNKLVSLCKQNIGHLCSVKGETDKAVQCYLETYELRKGNETENKLVTIVSLMEEYYKQKNWNESLKWLELGLKSSKNSKPSEQLLIYKLRVYEHLVKGYGNSFENLMKREILPYLEEKQLAYEKSIYLMILADNYVTKSKYKQAATYQRYANQELTKIKY